MKKTTTPTLMLNAAEQFLMKRLTDVLLLEKSMKGVRQKYDELWHTICRSTYPQLSFRSVREDTEGIQVGLGKNTWPSTSSRFPSGFYFSSISLENLCYDEGEPPQAGIWIDPPKSLRIDLEAHREPFRRKAKQAFGQVLKDWDGREISLWYELPESRQQLLSALTKNEGREFVEIMVSHLKKFRSLIPVVDAVFDRRGQ